jgi:hypothetical protein
VECPLRIVQYTCIETILDEKRVGGNVEVKINRTKPNFFPVKPVPMALFSQNSTRIRLGRKPGLVGENPATKNLI